MIDRNHCPICGALSSTAVKRELLPCEAGNGTRLDVQLLECAGCTHVYVSPAPSLEELAPFYESDYHVYAGPLPTEGDIRKTVEGALETGYYNHAPIVVGGRYLDVGCGLGDMVAAMQALGMAATGVEPSEAGARKAREAGRNVRHGLLHEANFPDGHFDVVSMYHVLEHAHEPLALLRECHRVLRPGGRLLVGVPNYDSLVREVVGTAWSALDPPRHLQHFRKATLLKAGRDAGFDVLSVRTESMSNHVAAELSGWLRKRLMIPRKVTERLKLAAPAASYLARRGEAQERGEAWVALLQKPGSVTVA